MLAFNKFNNDIAKTHPRPATVSEEVHGASYRVDRAGQVHTEFNVLPRPRAFVGTDEAWLMVQYGLVLRDPRGSWLLTPNLQALLLSGLHADGGVAPEAVIPAAAVYADGTFVDMADLLLLESGDAKWSELTDNYVLVGHVVQRTLHTHTCYRCQGIGRGVLGG